MEQSFENLVQYAKSKGATDAKLMSVRGHSIGFAFTIEMSFRMWPMGEILDVPTEYRHIN